MNGKFLLWFFMLLFFPCCASLADTPPIAGYDSALVIANWNDSVDAGYTVGLSDSQSTGDLPVLTATSKFGAGALDLTDGTKNITLSYENNFSPDKGTFETFIYPVDAASAKNYVFSVIHSGTDRMYLVRNIHATTGQQQLFFYYESNDVAASLSTPWEDPTSGSLSLNKWHHISVTWDLTIGGTDNEIAIYIDGVRKSFNHDVSISPWAESVTPSSIAIGAYGTGAVTAGAYFDSMRISDEVMYKDSLAIVPTQEFILPHPPISSPLLVSHWNSSANADNAVGIKTAKTDGALPNIVLSPYKFGYGALDFTDDSFAMYYNYNGNYDPNSGSFELTMYPTDSTVGNHYIYSVIYDGDNRIYLRREVNADGVNQRLFAYYESNNVGNYVATGWENMDDGILALNKWHHVALTWDFSKGAGSNELAIFIDGKRKGFNGSVNAEIWSDTVTPARIDIGRYGTSGGSRPGAYLDELRMSSMVEYSGDYAVPANEFLFPVAKTPEFGEPLLLSRYEFDANADFAVGNHMAIADSQLPAITASEYLYGDGSLDFVTDANGLYDLHYDINGNIDLNKGTFECFVKPESMAGGEHAYFFSLFEANLELLTNRMYFRRESHPTSGQYQLVAFYRDGSENQVAMGTGWLFPDQIMSIGDWHHVALIWDFTKGAGSNEMAIYVDGKRRAFINNIQAQTMSVLPAQIEIGRYKNYPNNPPKAYLSELRISGKVVYAGETYDVPGKPFRKYMDSDVSQDSFVDYLDFSILADEWQNDSIPGTEFDAADIDQDYYVGIEDLKIMVGNWLDSTCAYDPDCIN